jgi:hypothetical protein
MSYSFHDLHDDDYYTWVDDSELPFIGLISADHLYGNISRMEAKVFTTLLETNNTISFSKESFMTQIEDNDEIISSSSFDTGITFFNYEWEEVDLSSFNTKSLFRINILYFNLFIIGFLLIFAVSTTIVSIEKKNLHFEGLLLSKGFGKKRIFLMVFSQIFILFLLSTVLGNLIGFLTGSLWTKAYVNTNVHYDWSGNNMVPFFSFPIYFDFGEIFLFIGSNFILTIGLYLIFFLIQERKSISRLMIKF